MTPWLADPDVRLYHGDCLEVLRELPDRSVHMCATSPPFYGLRDYGTGGWEGGDSDCDHSKRSGSATWGPGSTGSSTLSGRPTNDSHELQGWTGGRCGKCGARRVDQQIGLEETPDQWVERLVAVFREVRRVLRDDGTLWVEIGDSYGSSGGNTHAGFNERYFGREFANDKQSEDKFPGETRSHPYKPKDLLGQPWLLAFALRADGWYLRSEIIWARPNPMPESVTDRPTKSHSTVFLLSKRPRYFWDADAIRQPHQPDGRHVTAHPGPGEHSIQARSNGDRWPGTGANARSVWTIPTEPTPFAHFATWPQALVRRMILAGTSERGCCPECGAPWVRETSTDYESSRQPGAWNDGGYDNKRTAYATHGVATKRVSTLGWSSSCAHDADPIPAVVLDPFSGSGTTSLVARNHGRHSIGIELNEQYLQIAAQRLQQLSLLAEGTV